MPDRPVPKKRRPVPSKVAVGYILCGAERKVEDRKGELVSYCDERGLVLEGIETDAGSFRSTVFESRPGGSATLRRLRGRGGATHLVLVRLNSTFANVADAAHIFDRLRRRKKHIHIRWHQDAPASTEGETGRLLWNTVSALGALDRWAARAAWAAAEGSGKVVKGFATAATPYGYRRDGSLWIEDAAEQSVIAEMKRLRADGFTLRRIADQLNRRGVPSKQGGKWYPATVQRAFYGKANPPTARGGLVPAELWRPDDEDLLRLANEKSGY